MTDHCAKCGERSEVMGQLVNGKCFLCRDDEEREAANEEAAWVASQNEPMTDEEHREYWREHKQQIERNDV